MVDQLWMSDDPMPSCDPCQMGGHAGCPDLIETPPWGLHACGCIDPCHDWRYKIAGCDLRPGDAERLTRVALAGGDPVLAFYGEEEDVD
jgi:hypothetical protein